MKTFLPKVWVFLFIIIFAPLSSLFLSTFSYSAEPHILINEIQIAGNTDSDEFVELFNPFNTNKTLTNWKLKKKSQTGYLSTLATFSFTVPGFGYLLFGQTNYDSQTIKDINYESSIGSNNTILLLDENDQIIDKVGMGTPFESQGTPAPQPINNFSIERTNHQDTDDNYSDFVINNSPNPQNSLSSPDTPMISPTPFPSSSPSPTVFPTPTIEPSPIPSSPSPSPTIKPSYIPDISPTSSVSPLLSPLPSIFPTPSPQNRIFFKVINFVCLIKYEAIKVRLFTFLLPKISCFPK